MLRFLLIAWSGLGLAVLGTLENLGIWNDFGRQLLYSLAAFAAALVYAALREGLHGGRLLRLRRAAAAWASCGLILLGALRLPFDFELQLTLTLGVENGLLSQALGALALSGMALCIPALGQWERILPRRRGGAALMLFLGVLALAAALAAGTGCLLPLPVLAGCWSLPAGFLLAGAANVAAALLQRPGRPQQS